MTVRINMVQGKCTVINMTTIVLSAKQLSCALACGIGFWACSEGEGGL
jgi:hypothetical protein